MNDLLGFGYGKPHHVEGTLGQVVVRAREDLLEALDGVLERHEHSLGSGEHLGHGEGLRHETLYLTRPRYGELVVFRQLIHSEDGNDVLRDKKQTKKSGCVVTREAKGGVGGGGHRGFV